MLGGWSHAEQQVAARRSQLVPAALARVAAQHLGRNIAREARRAGIHIDPGNRRCRRMMAPDHPRRRVTVLGFLLAMVLLPIGAVLAPLGVGIPIFAIAIALIFPDS
jgi:hypothetical protein